MYVYVCLCVRVCVSLSEAFASVVTYVCVYSVVRTTGVSSCCNNQTLGSRLNASLKKLGRAVGGGGALRRGLGWERGR